MSVQYVPDCTNSLSNSLSAGIAFAQVTSEDLKTILEDLENNNFQDIHSATAALQAALDSQPDDIKNSPEFANLVSKINGAVAATVANYHIVSLDGSVIGQISDDTTKQITINPNNDITNNSAQFLQNANISGDLADVESSFTSTQWDLCYGIQPQYQTKTYTVTDPKTGISSTFTVTAQLVRGDAVITNITLNSQTGTEQQLIDSGLASIQQIPGSTGTTPLTDLLKSLNL